MSIQAAFPTVEVRAIAPHDRHPTIFSTFDGLAVNEAMALVNDHDPRPLYFQFQQRMPGRFSWDYVEVGPEVWRVHITKLAGNHGQCCGSCGGA